MKITKQRLLDRCKLLVRLFRRWQARVTKVVKAAIWSTLKFLTRNRYVEFVILYKNDLPADISGYADAHCQITQTTKQIHGQRADSFQPFQRVLYICWKNWQPLLLNSCRDPPASEVVILLVLQVWSVFLVVLGTHVVTKRLLGR